MYTDILSNKEIIGKGKETYCCVELLYTEFVDDTYSGNLEECEQWCEDNKYTLGIDAQIVVWDCIDGITDFCENVYYKIPTEIIDAYERNVFDYEDVYKHFRGISNSLTSWDFIKAINPKYFNEVF